MIDYSDIAFWTNFYKDDCDADYDYFSWASDKAYLDMNRTLTFKDVPKDNSQHEKDRVDKDRRDLRNDGTKIIRNNFRNLTGDFNDWHEQVCTQMIEHYRGKLVMRDGKTRTETPVDLTYGQAQKWLNMTLKYLWLINRLGLIDNKEDADRIQKYQKDFHIPLDSYILRYIMKQNKNANSSFSSVIDNELSDEYSFSEFRELFGSAWSRINKPDDYFRLQKMLSDAISDKTPLEWELTHWHKALKYYDN